MKITLSLTAQEALHIMEHIPHLRGRLVITEATEEEASAVQSFVVKELDTLGLEVEGFDEQEEAEEIVAWKETIEIWKSFLESLI